VQDLAEPVVGTEVVPKSFASERGLGVASGSSLLGQAVGIVVVGIAAVVAAVKDTLVESAPPAAVTAGTQ